MYRVKGLYISYRSLAVSERPPLQTSQQAEAGEGGGTRKVRHWHWTASACARAPEPPVCAGWCIASAHMRAVVTCDDDRREKLC